MQTQSIESFAKEVVVQLKERDPSPPFFIIARRNISALQAFESIHAHQETGFTRQNLYAEGDGSLKDSLPSDSVIVHEDKARNDRLWFKVVARNQPASMMDKILSRLPGGIRSHFRSDLIFFVESGAVQVVKSYLPGEYLRMSEPEMKSFVHELVWMEPIQFNTLNMVPFNQAKLRQKQVLSQRAAEEAARLAARSAPIYADEILEQGTLGATVAYLQGLIAVHGEDAKVKFDAGYNNVSVFLEPVPK